MKIKKCRKHLWSVTRSGALIRKCMLCGRTEVFNVALFRKTGKADRCWRVDC